MVVAHDPRRFELKEGMSEPGMVAVSDESPGLRRRAEPGGCILKGAY